MAHGIKRVIIGTKEVQAIISTNAPEALWLLEEGWGVQLVAGH